MWLSKLECNFRKFLIKSTLLKATPKELTIQWVPSRPEVRPADWCVLEIPNTYECTVPADHHNSSPALTAAFPTVAWFARTLACYLWEQSRVRNWEALRSKENHAFSWRTFSPRWLRTYSCAKADEGWFPRPANWPLPKSGDQELMCFGFACLTIPPASSCSGTGGPKHTQM